MWTGSQPNQHFFVLVKLNKNSEFMLVDSSPVQPESRAQRSGDGQHFLLVWTLWVLHQRPTWRQEEVALQLELPKAKVGIREHRTKRSHQGHKGVLRGRWSRHHGREQHGCSKDLRADGPEVSMLGIRCSEKSIIWEYLVSECSLSKIECRIRTAFEFYINKVGGNFFVRPILTAQNEG